MRETVRVQAARIPDRNRLLRELRDAGLGAEPVGEMAIRVPVDGSEESSDELLAIAEGAIMRIGAPFVPMKHEDTIYIRPPLS